MAERLRLGRHHRDTVYLQTGEQPSSEDQRVAVFTGPDAARYAASFVAAGGEHADPVLYLLWSGRHGEWWRPDACGYTTNVAEAGRYSRAEAVRYVVASAQCGVREQVTSMVAAPENWPTDG